MANKNNYLLKYCGKYKVLANFDLQTGKLPRDENGNIDESYDDIYIALKNEAQIYYIGRDGRDGKEKRIVKHVFECLIPSIRSGHNLIRNMYEKLILYRECDDYERSNYDNMYDSLVNNKIILNIYEDDEEIFFQFYETNFDTIIEYLQPVAGTKRSPFSSKYTKQKINYTIPENDMLLYSNATNKKITKDNMFVINRINKEFDQIVISLLSKKNNPFDIKADKKISGLNGRNYYHHLGEKIWKKYIEFIDNHIDTYVKEISFTSNKFDCENEEIEESEE